MVEPTPSRLAGRASFLVAVIHASGYPLETVINPTGAGDSFAGGFFGFLDQHRTRNVTDDLLRCAAVYGSVMASFTIEDFGNERLRSLNHGRDRDPDARLQTDDALRLAAGAGSAGRTAGCGLT